MTGRLLARELGLEAHQWTLAFQSRFGRGRWLEPYTAATLAKLGATRPRRVDVFAPGFVSDCLETLEELAIEGKRTFQAAGGGDYEVIPCLNEHARWIAALADIVLANLQGWLSPPPSGQAREATLLRAKVLGGERLRPTCPSRRPFRRRSPVERVAADPNLHRHPCRLPLSSFHDRCHDDRSRKPSRERHLRRPHANRRRGDEPRATANRTTPMKRRWPKPPQ